MTIFSFDDYKAFVNSEIGRLPKNGRGELQRIAVALRMHTTSVSQVFRGEKDLNLEQAANLCDHWGISGVESDYFVSLVEFARAESVSLKKILRSRLRQLKETARQLGPRVSKDRVLNEAERYQFYSEWHYSAIRLLSEIPKFSDARSIAEKLGLPLSTVKMSIEFLLELKLIVETKGHLSIGPSRTFLEATSPLIVRHHTNWRLKAIERYSQMNGNKDFAVTAPMTVSAEDAEKIRETLLSAVESVLTMNSKSRSEELRILNLDWLQI